MPIISIIIPIYNGEKHLEKGLKSILRQSIGVKNLEVLLVDDRSTDNTKALLKPYEDQYPEVFRYIELEENSGHSSLPRNKGIELARGEYIMFLDQDDWYLDDACELLLQGIRKRNSEMAVAWYETKYSPANQTILGNHYLSKAEDNLSLIAKIGPDIWSNIYRKDLLDRWNIRFPGYALGEDLYFVTACLYQANGIEILPSVVYHYNIRDMEEASVFHTKSESLAKRLNDGYQEVLTLMKSLGKGEQAPLILKPHFVVYVESVVYSSMLEISEKVSLLKDISWLARLEREAKYPPFIELVRNLLLEEEAYPLKKLLEFETLATKVLGRDRKDEE